jgi:hypothetical protein
MVCELLPGLFYRSMVQFFAFFCALTLKSRENNISAVNTTYVLWILIWKDPEHSVEFGFDIFCSGYRAEIENLIF